MPVTASQILAVSKRPCRYGIVRPQVADRGEGLQATLPFAQKVNDNVESDKF
jgi:hypothetical protein